jgi:NADH-quinone oxidoreductase subunit E
MLTEQEKTEIARELAAAPSRRAALPEALKIVQRRTRWIDDQSLADVAGHLGLSLAEADAVATFYNLIFRKPVGRHVILVCDSVSCWLMGYESLLEHLGRRLGIGLGQTTPDGRFTLLPTACLGACDRAPCMMIDDDLHGPLTPQSADEALAKYQ